MAWTLQSYHFFFDTCNIFRSSHKNMMHAALRTSDPEPLLATGSFNHFGYVYDDISR